MEGLARAGNGTAEFVKEGERMQPKVFDTMINVLCSISIPVFMQLCGYIALNVFINDIR